MIGSTYYSTGISARQMYGGEWFISLEFFDLGHAEARATSGKLCYTYLVKIGELRLAIETLLFDAKKLGIKFEIAPNIKPKFYISSIPEIEMPDDWRTIFQPFADSKSWELCLSS